MPVTSLECNHRKRFEKQIVVWAEVGASDGGGAVIEVVDCFHFD